MTLFQAKHLVLVLLVVQNTCLVLLMRYSRTRPGTMYLGSTAVCCDEFMKLVTCLGILTVGYILGKRKGESGGEYSQLSTGQTAEGDGDNSDEFDDDADADANVMAEGNNKPGSFVEYLSRELQFDFRVAGVAAIYTVQKNLLYLAISNLDAAVFQVTYQAKILTTAIFSCILLGRKLGWLKIAGLFILTMGVAIVQLDKVEENASKSYQEQHQLVGVLAVLGACCTSGFAGVYFELVLKPRQSAAGANGAVEGPGRTTEEADGGGLGRDVKPRPPPSVWAKNVQLSAFALAIALATVCIKDHNTVLEGGFFQGYSPLVWTVISFEALGGLVTAAVIKYADNILKSFATAVSIVTSTIVSACVFGFVISKMFVIGCLLVFVAIGLYSRKDKTADGPAPSTASSQTPCAQKKGSDISMVQIDSRSSMPSADMENGVRIK